MRSAAITESPPVAIRVRRGSRLWIALELALLLLGSAVFCCRVLPHAWRAVNTDFPNYYITARLVHDGYATDRIYEWDWFARQKDRLGIDQKVVGFNTLTPISALVLSPLAPLDPLSAKHVWVLFNLLLLAPTLWLLRSLSGISWRWLGIATIFSIPLYKNIEYGQYYIVVLLLMTAALWLYVRGWSSGAGAVIALAAGLKIFPVFFVFYFLKKRDWRAACACVASLLLLATMSIFVFGHLLVTRYIVEVLPAALRGDAMNPYSLNASSISALVHHLFAYEPELNPHPVAQCGWAIAILQPLLQSSVLALALLFITKTREREAVCLEWATLVVALLTVSTLPASYHFVLLLLPCAVWCSYFLRRYRRGECVGCITLWFLIGWPIWPVMNAAGWHALLGVPRLWLVLLLLAMMYRELWRSDLLRSSSQRTWAGALATICLIQMISLGHREKDLYSSQQWRLSTSPSIYSSATPVPAADGISFSAMTDEGWRSAQLSDRRGLHVNASEVDQLAVAASESSVFVEIDSTTTDIVRLRDGPAEVVVRDGVRPAISPDGRWLFYLRLNRGRASLWVRDMQGRKEEIRLTTPDLDVYDLSVGPVDTVVFSALTSDRKLELFATDAQGKRVSRFGILDARYPAISPDRRWLAYSVLERGNWHLTLRDLASGADRQLGVSACNDVSPVWEADSRDLIYLGDCGRGLGQTALYRRTVIP